MAGIIWILLAVIIDVISNLLLKYADGFKKKKICLIAVLMSIGVYYCMMNSFNYVQFVVGYTAIGFLGIAFTNIGGILFFNTKLTLINKIGILLALVAVILLNFE